MHLLAQSKLPNLEPQLTQYLFFVQKNIIIAKRVSYVKYFAAYL